MFQKKPKPNRRRGWTTLWLIIWLPVLLVLFSALLGVANLWLARVELENGLEAAALAAVKEWGDAGGGSTLVPRQIGVEFAAANIIRGEPVEIGLNHDPAAGCNENQFCGVKEGNLIFGAIDDTDPDHVIFDAGKCPSCGVGTVLFDVVGNGSGNLVQENAWGISFYRDPELPPDIRIDRIIIDLQGSGGNGIFVGTEVVDAADPEEGWAMGDQSGPLQPDIFGFNDVLAQTTFTNLGSGKLQIDFFPDGPDGGFEPGDRIRFGHDVDLVAPNPGSTHNDADGIGADDTTVTIIFSIGGVPQPPVTGTYVDTTDRLNDSLDVAIYNPVTMSFAHTPGDNPIPDLPYPQASAANNNGQSYALVAAGPPAKFGVRAQAKLHVRSFGSIFLGCICDYCVQAKATAEYDCVTRRVRLVRIDEFICP
jgi:hypothetical protein